jgi:hypothetical protein
MLYGTVHNSFCDSFRAGGYSPPTRQLQQTLITESAMKESKNFKALQQTLVTETTSRLRQKIIGILNFHPTAARLPILPNANNFAC